MLDAARGVVADFAYGVRQFERAQGKEVRGHNLIVDHRRRLSGQVFAGNLTQPHFARILIVPEQAQHVGVHGFHGHPSYRCYS